MAKSPTWRPPPARLSTPRTFLTISDVSHPTVTVSLDETDMDKLVVGNPAVVTFTALPGKSFTGKVSLANPQMNSFGPFRAATGQITLDSEAASTFETLPLGLSATITITGQRSARTCCWCRWRP